MNRFYKLKQWIKGLTLIEKLYWISAALLLVTWFIGKEVSIIRISTTAFFGITFLLYIVYGKKNTDNIYLTVVNSISAIMILMFTLIHIILLLKGYLVGITLFISTIFAVFLSLQIFYMRQLMDTKSLWGAILFYILVSMMSITLFGYGYTISDAWAGHGLIYAGSGQDLESTNAHLYFSSSVFYSNVAGDIIPQGFGRFWMQIESAFSQIFHIIILGIVIAKVGDSLKFKLHKSNRRGVSSVIDK